MGKYLKTFLKCAILHLFLVGNYSVAQNVVLKGGDIIIKEGTFLVVQGNLKVNTATLNSEIDLDGTILLHGDIENNSLGSVFFNQETVPNGWVVMPNANAIQHIKGSSFIHFENLSLSGSEKKLMNNNSSVNGILRLNAKFNLNSNNFILNNKNSSSLEHNGGFLFAETNPIQGIGSFQWSISNNIETFKIPFGTGNSNISDIPIIFQTISAGSIDGGIVFSTYPTDYTNTPFPDFVNSLNPYMPTKTADRFWLTDGDSYIHKPTSTLSLTYAQSDIESGNSISKSALSPIFYHNSGSIWSNYPTFFCDSLFNTMTVLNISPNELAKNWTLSSDEISADIFFPNAFSPDLDGPNETFKPVMNFIPKQYAIYIYNRWGELVFTSNDPNNGWNGLFQNTACQIGTYSWIVKLLKPNGKEQHYKGIVSIVK